MSRSWPVSRTREEERPASVEVSRLLVMGFLVAALLGLLTGGAWLGWNVVKNWLSV